MADIGNEVALDLIRLFGSLLGLKDFVFHLDTLCNIPANSLIFEQLLAQIKKNPNSPLYPSGSIEHVQLCLCCL